MVSIWKGVIKIKSYLRYPFHMFVIIITATDKVNNYEGNARYRHVSLS